MSNDAWGAAARWAGLGTGLLGVCGALARPGSVSPTESALFARVNDGVGPAEGPVWLAMQFGNGLTALVVPAGFVLAGRSSADAARVALAGAGGWQLAKAVKRLVPRGRPASLLDSVVLRDGDPGGGGFVSGHATVAMATAVAAGASLGPDARRWLIGAAVVVGLARVHVGAHLPLDVVGGAGLGLVWGSLCGVVPMPAAMEAGR
jgi:membrane-associated phospholipid phosphatase